jgi:hypothetical protein
MKATQQNLGHDGKAVTQPSGPDAATRRSYVTVKMPRPTLRQQRLRPQLRSHTVSLLPNVLPSANSLPRATRAQIDC